MFKSINLYILGNLPWCYGEICFHQNTEYSPTVHHSMKFQHEDKKEFPCSGTMSSEPNSKETIPFIIVTHTTPKCPSCHHEKSSKWNTGPETWSLLSEWLFGGKCRSSNINKFWFTIEIQILKWHYIYGRLLFTQVFADLKWKRCECCDIYCILYVLLPLDLSESRNNGSWVT